MMKSFKFLLSLIAVVALLTYTGCGKNPGPGQSPQDAQLVKLSKTWKATAVTLNGTAQPTYTSKPFTLVISSTAGQTTFGFNTGSQADRSAVAPILPWQSSGNLSYGTDFSTQLTRVEDSLPITYSVTDTQLQMTFNYTGNGIPARVGSVAGTWVFTFGL